VQTEDLIQNMKAVPNCMQEASGSSCNV